MGPWAIRAAGMALVHAAVQVVLAGERARDPSAGTVLRPAALGLLVGVAVLWAAVDSWRRRPGAGTTWFVAALVAGPVAGLLGWLGQVVLVDSTGLDALGPALLGGAAFTALLVLAPAGLGLLLGRLVAPPAPAAPRLRPVPRRRSLRPTPGR